MSIKCSQEYLDKLLKKGDEAVVYMTSGIRLVGIIIETDDISLVLQRVDHSNQDSMLMLIYTTAISTVVSLDDDCKFKNMRHEKSDNQQ